MRGLGWLRWRGGPTAGPPLGSFEAEGFIAIDLETTGLDSRRDAIVALAAVPFVGGRRREGFVTLVDPGRPIPAASTAIHGITDDMVAGAPRIAEVVHQLDALLDRQPLVGHGIGFDVAVLDRERRARGLGRLANPAVDTRVLAGALHPEWPDIELESVSARLGVDVVARHTAEGDAVTAGMVLLAMLPALASGGVRTLGDLLWLQRSAHRRV